jgi:pseudouridylate synthase
MNPKLIYHPEVKTALENKQAVVALESTVISHGLPYPLNLETAHQLEAQVRSAGAIPATIALLEGRVHVGLDDAQLELMARGGIEKVSLWNLPAIVAKRLHGGTTVAATAHLARLAGIDVFATGGIGGVHFDAFDESADLPALARTPIIVVCAGAKSILNLHATLERLETLGVAVIGYKTASLPAFHTPHSPFKVAAQLDTPLEIANAFLASKDFGLHQAILVANPVSEGLPYEQVERWVEAANHEARREGVNAKALTPFLLRRLSSLSNGETDRVNGILLRENARLGGEIAVALAKLRSILEV